MAIVNPDFSEAFEVIPEGRYQARVSDYQCKVSKNSGAKMVAWNLQVVGGEYDGRKVTHMTMIEGKGAGILKHFLKTCDGVYDSGPFDPDHYKGCRIGIEIQHEDYQGKSQARVRDVFPDPGSKSFDSFAAAPVGDDKDIPF